MPQEASDAIAYGPVKEGIGIRRFDNAALVHEYHLVGDMARKTHLMGDDHHCRAAFCEPDDDVQHLLDRLRIESRGRFVDQKGAQSGRESWRGRVCKYVVSAVVAGSLKKKTKHNQ